MHPARIDASHMRTLSIHERASGNRPADAARDAGWLDIAHGGEREKPVLPPTARE